MTPNRICARKPGHARGTFPFSVPGIHPVTDPVPRGSRRVHRPLPLGCALAVCALITGTTARAEPSAASAPASVAPNNPFSPFEVEASQRFGIPAAWIDAVIRAESAGEVRALSPQGAMGLMQIMPQTWGQLRLRYGLGDDPYDPRDNILAGAGYLAELRERYGSPGFLAAYNAGPGRYEDNLASGRPLPEETRAYVAMLARAVGEAPAEGAQVVAELTASWTDAPLFAVQGSSGSTAARTSTLPQAGSPSADGNPADRTAFGGRSDGLFVALSRRNSAS